MVGELGGDFALGLESVDELGEGGEVARVGEVEGFAEGDEVCKEGVPVGLEREVDDFVEVVVVYVGEDAEHLSVYVFGHAYEVGGERHALLCREERLVVELLRDPRQRVVDVLVRGQADGLLVGVDPQVVHARARVHGRTGVRSHKLGEHAVELVEIREELEQVERNPLAQVDVLGQRHDRLERALDQRRAHVGLAHEQRPLVAHRRPRRSRVHRRRAGAGARPDSP
jgi:hypothetical protein